jgi:hypothetical protein
MIDDIFRALDLLRRPGAHMIRTHGWRGGYFIVPGGGKVDNAIAQKVIDHEQVIGVEDGLWPGHDQTWRMR